MKRIVQYLLVIVFCSHYSIFSQEIRINLINSPLKNASFNSLSGEKISFIDSLYSVSNGMFIYNNPEKLNRDGLYRVIFSPNKILDFVFDGNDIEFKTDYNHLGDSLKIIKSESNKTFYEFIKLNRTYKTKTELLQLILVHYPKEDEYYQTTINRLTKLQDEYLKFINVTSQKENKSFIARYVRSSQLPVIDVNISSDEHLNYLKSNALNNVDFNDYDLIYSDAFANKSIEYLTYYRNPQLPLGLLEEEFNKAVDTILTKASINILVYQHVADYLVDGFKKFGFNNVVDYIIENYVIKDGLCLDEVTENSIQKRINQSKLFSIGSKVPNIILKNDEGKEVELNKIEADKILILFYAIWCSHCKEMLPEIYKIYKAIKNFEVFAVSLDEKKDEWINFIKNNSFDWINVSDLKGWESKAASDYYIYATPTMFLVDNEKIIIAKPLTISGLKKSLE